MYLIHEAPNNCPREPHPDVQLATAQQRHGVTSGLHLGWCLGRACTGGVLNAGVEKPLDERAPAQRCPCHLTSLGQLSRLQLRQASEGIDVLARGAQVDVVGVCVCLALCFKLGDECCHAPLQGVYPDPSLLELLHLVGARGTRGCLSLPGKGRCTACMVGCLGMHRPVGLCGVGRCCGRRHREKTGEWRTRKAVRAAYACSRCSKSSCSRCRLAQVLRAACSSWCSCAVTCTHTRTWVALAFRTQPQLTTQRVTHVQHKCTTPRPGCAWPPPS